jgi:glutamine synthetase
MFVLDEVLERHGFVSLWHEKPFKKMNGSGKHANWSLNYFDKSGNIRNLFSPQAYNDKHFLLFTLIKMKAILDNQ